MGQSSLIVCQLIFFFRFEICASCEERRIINELIGLFVNIADDSKGDPVKTTGDEGTIFNMY
jgi:hypothetical protein